MKDHQSEWTSISDLMAGVMAIVMLLLVVSIVQQNYADIIHKQELSKLSNNNKKIVHDTLVSIHDSFDEMDIMDLVEFDFEHQKITLKDGIFSIGSACVTSKAKNAIISIQDKLIDYLNSLVSGKIVIEGHTDSVPVSHPEINFQKYCAVYDDNYTLSAARAREARNLLITSLSENNAKRVIVAGYGDSNTLPGISSADGRNRRIEILFLSQDE